MFLLSPKDKIARAVQQAKTLDEAADHVCEILEEESVPATVTEKRDENLYFCSVESVVDSLMSKVRNSDYNVTVDKEEVWRGALMFYTKENLNQQ